MSHKDVTDGLTVDKNSSEPPLCEGCIMGKHHRLPFPKEGRNRATRPGELIHSDVCGPMQKPSLKGSLYFVTFRDDFTGYGVINFMKKKSELFQHLKNFSARVRAEVGDQITTLRSDNGGEYTSAELQSWLAENGIHHETSAPRTPEQNGVAERYNRTILESAKSMLHFSGLKLELWAEASACAVYLLNRVLCKAMTDMTPYEGWHKRKPNLSHLRVFGCYAYAHVPKEERLKLDPKGLKCVFVGYCETQKAFRLRDPASNKVKISRDVLFNEKDLFGRSISVGVIPCVNVPVPITSGCNGEGGETQVSNGRGAESISHTMGEEENTGQSPAGQLPTPDENIPLANEEEIEDPFYGFESSKKSCRLRKKPQRLIEDPNFLGIDDKGFISQVSFEEPQTYEEATSSDQSHEWNAAMEEEIKSLKEHETWRLEPLPIGRRAIKSKWVYKVKRNSSNEKSPRFKARLVAKGYSQRQGIDFFETYAPVVRHESVRAVLAIAAVADLEILQLDDKTAFLHGDLDEEIYMEQPEGFVDPHRPEEVCRLQKSLYGLKQASRSWNTKFDGFITKFGFTRSSVDPCVYFCKEGDGVLVLALWVDDGLLCGTHKEKLYQVAAYLSDRIDITVQDVNHFVGIKITRDRLNRTIHLSQEEYVNKILKRF